MCQTRGQRTLTKPSPALVRSSARRTDLQVRKPLLQGQKKPKIDQLEHGEQVTCQNAAVPTLVESWKPNSRDNEELRSVLSNADRRELSEAMAVMAVLSYGSASDHSIEEELVAIHKGHVESVLCDTMVNGIGSVSREPLSFVVSNEGTNEHLMMKPEMEESLDILPLDGVESMVHEDDVATVSTLNVLLTKPAIEHSSKVLREEHWRTNEHSFKNNIEIAPNEFLSHGVGELEPTIIDNGQTQADSVPYEDREVLQSNIINTDETMNCNSQTETELKTAESLRNRDSILKLLGANRLTFIDKESSLAQIDFLLNMNMRTAAMQLFNSRRRKGFRFTIDIYNKLLMAAINDRSEKDSSQILLLNYSIMIDQVERTSLTKTILLKASEKFKLSTLQCSVEKELEQVHNTDLSLMEAEVGTTAGPVVDGRVETFQRRASSIPGLEGADLCELVKERSELENLGYQRIPSIKAIGPPNEADLEREACYHDNVGEWRKQFIDHFNLKMKQLREKYIVGMRLPVIVNELQRRGESTRGSTAELRARFIGMLESEDRSVVNDLIAREAVVKTDSIQNEGELFASALTAEEHAEILFEEFIPKLAREKFGLPLNNFCSELGQRIYQVARRKFTPQDRHEVASSVAHEYLLAPASNEREHFRELSQRIMNTDDDVSQLKLHLLSPWTFQLKVMAAATVMGMLKDVAMIRTANGKEKDEPAIIHSIRVFKSTKLGILKVHEDVHTLYSSVEKLGGNLTFQYDELPHLLPPRPWTSITDGSCWFVNEQLVRGYMDRHSSHHLNSNCKSGKMNQLYDSLNELGGNPWKVNEPVLDVVLEMFAGEGNKELKIVEPLDRIDKNHPEYLKIYSEQFSLYTTLLYKLSIAQSLREKVFWTPINCDFRGRVYPIAPHLNCIGNDVSRGLMCFATGKPLGADGLWWLKVNLANLHGEKAKAPLQERAEFVDDNMQSVLDSANRPLDGDKWWQSADDPFQALACCMEIRNALRLDDPSAHVSHLQVIQDGTCNGLQHYAALGRDLYGARQVNLVNADRPADLYSEVATIVESMRLNDAANGVKEAEILKGVIARKVVKQTVMTIVYGVTFFGAVEQIERQLPEHFLEKRKLAVYVATKVFSTVKLLFTSAKQIQVWLLSCAAQITLAGQTIDWVTPLGLPVTQPYYKLCSRPFKTDLQSVNATSTTDESKSVDSRKQKGAFAPNFIHSLDSTHMLMTALRCRQAGLTFASVHDSYWTHACDMQTMNKFCREEFVNLHTLPILPNLHQHLMKFQGQRMHTAYQPRGGDKRIRVEIDPLPELGDLNIEEVLDSTYFFS